MTFGVNRMTGENFVYGDWQSKCILNVEIFVEELCKFDWNLHWKKLTFIVRFYYNIIIRSQKMLLLISRYRDVKYVFSCDVGNQ